MIRLLIIPGGGVFGCIPAYFLKHVDVSKADVYGGTSVGSQLACMYARGMSGDTVFDHFTALCPDIFHRSIWRRLTRFGIKRPLYSDKNLEGALRYLLDVPFMDLRPVFVPAYYWPLQKTKVFDSVDDMDDHLPAWEVVRASSAAPYYFPPYKGFLDGGWWCNNPALATAVGVYRKMGIPFSEMKILVVGTGHRAVALTDSEIREMEGDMEKWGALDLVGPVLDSITLSNEQGVSAYCESIGFGGYRIFDPFDIGDRTMVDAKEVPKILEDCRRYKEDFLEVWKWFMED
jgi:hypothetical protein